MDQTILTMEGIVKKFPGVIALNHAKLNIRKGEVMALMGENGAGKSTLMKILTGVYKKDEGEIRYEGKPVEYHDVRQAQKDGIAIIHQELNLIAQMSIYENIFLGREKKKAGGALDREYMKEKSRELLALVHMDLNPERSVGTLSIAQQQMVEIAKTLLDDARVIIMDEPTDALPDEEVESLFQIIRDLKKRGKGIVYISHRVKEIFEICDRVTVMRDGEFISEKSIGDITKESLIEMMVGRALNEQFPHVDVKPGDEVLRVEGLTNQYVRDVGFTLRAGEILGIAGLVGAGRTELAKTLYGCYPWQKGTVCLHGKQVQIRNTGQAIKNGIYYMTEDRKKNGLILLMDVKSNITLSSLKKISRFGRIARGREREVAADYVKKIQIKTPSICQRVRNLSGGNQQKVILSKAMMTEPDVLILDEPTRGIDVGAKKEIYHLINELKQRGKAIIMISSEMPEILGMSDRIMVLSHGIVKGELNREEATQEMIMETILY